MLGAIAGDTIGSVYEFNNTKDYNFKLLSPRSEYTDDSIMTMAVAKWLLMDENRTHEMLEKYMVEFAKLFPCPMGGYGGMFSNWLFRPWALGSRRGYPNDGTRHPYGSWGNGSAMRASACGWAADTLEETERIAAVSASITHDHLEGIKGAQATAAAIFMARTGKSKDEIRQYIAGRYGYDLSHTWKELQPSYRWDSSCQGTVPQAIICFLDSTDFEDAIRKAVSMGGDSDTLACITGGIAEAFYGGVPSDIASAVWAKLPKNFQDLLSEFAQKTSYGKVFLIQ